MTYDPKVAHPKIPVEADYPYLLSTIRPDGSQELRSIQPGKEAYSEIEASGNYRSYDKDGNQVEVSIENRHQYIGGSLVTTVDNQHDLSVGGSVKLVAGGEVYVESKGNQYFNTEGQVITLSKGSQINVTTEGDKQIVVGGDLIINVAGNLNQLVEKDVISQVNGARSEVVSGDYTINSPTSITLRCGGSSIVLSPSGITITASRIDFVQG